MLLRRGYSPVCFSRAVLDPPPGKALAVTFDDGYRSVLTDAFPILAALGVPGTVFVPTDFVGATVAAWPGTDCWIGTAHEHELMPMTWEELGILQDAAWEVGSHARTHARLVAVGDAELADELVGSRAEIERELGERCVSLAYPYGETDVRVVRAAHAAGYGAACTLTASFTRASTLTWPRVGVFRHDGQLRFRAKVSPSVLRLRATRWWSLVRPGRLQNSSRSGGP
jgi:peptidoglycan/xylan/chitin deacetylase (PgdA/CDA1 family)